MPIPKPRPGEKQQVFIGRCMKVVSKIDSFRPKNVQLGMCYSSWKNAKGIKEVFCIMKKIRKIVERIKAERQKVPKFYAKVEFKKIQEQFVSIDQALRAAVDKAYGKDAWLRDFSDKEVVFRTQFQPEGEYQKVGYKIAGGIASFVGTPVAVKKVITYEKEITADSLIQLASLEASLREQRGRKFEDIVRRRK